eukprot:scaffold12477_cov119-Isochrysis_galbana.AAC.6
MPDRSRNPPPKRCGALSGSSIVSRIARLASSCPPTSSHRTSGTVGEPIASPSRFSRRRTDSRRCDAPKRPGPGTAPRALESQVPQAAEAEARLAPRLAPLACARPFGLRLVAGPGLVGPPMAAAYAAE